jgi:hypothetical protein
MRAPAPAREPALVACVFATIDVVVGATGKRRSLLSACVLAGALLALALLAGGAPAKPASFTLGGKSCKLIPPARTASALGTGRCEGVRPGGLVETRAPGEGGDTSFCTMNFLFRGSDGRRYIGTAGHCVLGESAFDGERGEKRWRRRGPIARDSEGDPIGRYAYAVLEDPRDFALIRLRKRVATNPGMCHFGGPTGVNADQTPGTVALNYYGNGLLAGDTVPARTLYALGMPDPDHVYATGPAAPGDSGSGVITADGRALGVLVTFGLHLGGIGSGGVDAGAVGITRLAPQLERAAERLGIRLRLRTAGLM